MSSINVQPQPSYKYTPSSSASTRQILESSSKESPKTPATSSAAAPLPESTEKTVPFRPQVFTRRSSNYADAAAAATASTAKESTTPIEKKDEGEKKGSGAGAWKPSFARKQSWSRQDMKHELQMSVVGEGEVREGMGFSQGKK